MAAFINVVGVLPASRGSIDVPPNVISNRLFFIEKVDSGRQLKNSTLQSRAHFAGQQGRSPMTSSGLLNFLGFFKYENMWHVTSTGQKVPKYCFYNIEFKRSYMFHFTYLMNAASPMSRDFRYEIGKTWYPNKWKAFK